MLNGGKKNINSWLYILLIIIIFITALFFSVCIRTDGNGVISPSIVMKNIMAFFKYKYYIAFSPAKQYEQLTLINNLPEYSTTITNLNSVFITALSGGILAVSGAVYQTVFRNPLAAPTMLGVSSGIQIGLLILVLKFSSAAISMKKEQYIYSYSFGLGTVLLIFILSKIVQKNGNNVTDMLLVGVVLNQLFGVILTYYEVTMPLDDLETLQNFTLGRLSSISGESLKIYLVVVLIGIIPIFLLRFSINSLAFGADEARTMGVSSYAIQTICLLSATILVAASIIHCGSIGVISLIIPFICRQLFGGNFKDMFPQLIMFGAFLLLICRAVSNVFCNIFGYVPTGIFVSIIGVPLFIAIMSKENKRKELS